MTKGMAILGALVLLLSQLAAPRAAAFVFDSSPARAPLPSLRQSFADPTAALAALEAAARRLLPPPPPLPADEHGGGSGRARSLLGARGRRAGSSSSSSSAVALAAVGNYTVLDYAYVVATVTPRSGDGPGSCPPGGGRGSEAQLLAKQLLRSFRMVAPYRNATLKPLQCVEKPGVWEQLLAQDNNRTSGINAYWVFEATRWPASADLGGQVFYGDHTYFDFSGEFLRLPRASSCYRGALPGGAVLTPWVRDGSPRIPPPLRGWCDTQDLDGKGALSLNIVYVTRAVKGKRPCADQLWNGAESGVDCGTPCPSSRCAVGGGCSNLADCQPGLGCDKQQINQPDPSAVVDGTWALGGLSTCALTCAAWAAQGRCPNTPNKTVLDERYADEYCAVGFKGAGTVVACTGSTYAYKRPGKPCCTPRAACRSTVYCDAATQVPDPDLDNRCPAAPCTREDNEQCCLDRAPCSSAFDAAECRALDAFSIYNATAYCAGPECDAAADKAACCPPRARCSSRFTPDLCLSNDPQQSDSSLQYSVVGDGRCAGTACNVASDADWNSCCRAAGYCQKGFFKGGRSCPTGTVPAPGSPTCAGRICTDADSASCCRKIPEFTCSSEAAPLGSPPCLLNGPLVANSTTKCYSQLNCMSVCCTKSLEKLKTCDELMNNPETKICEQTGFLSEPYYPGGQCSERVTGSCKEMCCSRAR